MFKEVTNGNLSLFSTSNKRTPVISPCPVSDFVHVFRGFLSRTVVMVVLSILTCDSKHQRSQAEGEKKMSHPPGCWFRAMKEKRKGTSQEAIADDMPELGLEKEKRKSRNENWCQGTRVCRESGQGTYGRPNVACSITSHPWAVPSLLSWRPEAMTGLLELRTSDLLGLHIPVITRFWCSYLRQKEVSVRGPF